MSGDDPNAFQRTSYAYDPNGNIIDLTRNGNSEGLVEDDLLYEYPLDSLSQKPINNKLQSVTDISTSFSAGYMSGTSTFDYDMAGNLIKEAASSGLTTDITWTPYGKVDQTLSGTQKVEFGYDSAQNRYKKAIFPNANQPNSTDSYYIRDAAGNVLSVLKVDNGIVTWEEQHIYGSKRMGVVNPDVVLDAVPVGTFSRPHFVEEEKTIHGNKKYELSNHLGNVLAVIGDRREAGDYNADGVPDSWKPMVYKANDYFPFGLDVPNRSYTLSGSDYRYGFNGKEKDTEGEWGSTTHYDYGFRIYNPAIAKFLSVDPLTKSYPELTPYQFAHNTHVWAIDLDGLEGLTHQEVIEALTSYDPKLQFSDYTIVRATSFEPEGFSGRSLFQIYPGRRDGGGHGNVTYLKEINVQGKSIKVHDAFSFGENQKLYKGYANYNNSFSVEAAAFFAPGPAIFKSGKYLKSFLSNSAVQNVVKGFPEVNLKLAQSGFNFKNSNRVQEFNQAITKIQNTVNKSFEADDLEGAIKEIHGFSSRGQHLKKVRDGITGLQNQINILSNHLDQGNLFGEAKSAANGAIKTAKEAIKLGTEVLESAEKSARNF